MATRWLYNSDGDAIAYVNGEYVFTPKGSFIGKVYEDNTVWNGEYVGQIMLDDRLFYDTRSLKSMRGIPGLPSLPGFVGEPPYRGPQTVPLGFRDVELS